MKCSQLVWVKIDDDITPQTPYGGQVMTADAGSEWAGGIYTPLNTGAEVQFAIGNDPCVPQGQELFDRLRWSNPTPIDWKGSWVHYGFVKNTNTGFMAIYRNGEMVAMRNDAYKPIVITRWDLGNYNYKGLMDELRVYSYALSQEEFLNLAGKTQIYQPLLVPLQLIWLSIPYLCHLRDKL